MTAFLLILLIGWICVAAGRQLAVWCRLPTDATALERNLIGYALGLGVLAYGILLLGLLGLLSLWGALGWLIALALLGLKQDLPLARSLFAPGKPRTRSNGEVWGIILLGCAFAAVSIVGVYTPPTEALEWDSLAYHLADPKLYVQAHRILYLPWESHSNFAFTAEMWYTLGLLFHSVTLAKWFHFSCGAALCLTVYALGVRQLTPRVGLWASLLLASTPLVFWEAGIAYADLATAFFATVTLLCVLTGAAQRNTAWLWMGAVLMGFTLSTKATALSVLGLLAVGLLYCRVRVWAEALPRALGQVSLWCLLAVAVGSPWYVKSAALTGNPVYPFYFQIFGGKYWSQTDAEAYDRSNAEFGVGRSPDKWLLAPWNLTMGLMPGHALDVPTSDKGFNDRQVALATLSPVLLGALFFPAFRRNKAPWAITALSLFALGGWILWFLTAQHVRYLLTIYPALCLLGAWALAEAWASRSLSRWALAALAGCSLLFSLYIAAVLLIVEAPVVFGKTSRERYLTASDPAYPALEFINTRLPRNAKVVFYGNPLGFYCDRPYLWGEQGHSNFIPYDSFHSAEDLRRYLQSIGVTDILVNANPRLHYFSMSPADPGYTRWVYDLTAGASAPLFTHDGVAVYSLPTGAAANDGT